MDFDITCDCGGKVNINDWQLNRSGLFYHKEVENVLFLQTDYPFSYTEVSLFDCVMPGAVAVMNLEHLISCMEMQLKILSRHNRSSTISGVYNDRDYFSMRKMVCEFILYFRAYMNSIKWDLGLLEAVIPEINKDVDTLFESIRRFFSTLRNTPDSTLLYAASNIGNKCKQQEFHVYHMHIELRWFFVTLMYSRTMWYQYTVHAQLEEFENTLAMIINDLIYSALKVFERLSLNWTMDLMQKTPYNCTCVRELWLMLQIFINNLENRMTIKVFWDHVNICIDKVLNKNETQGMSWHRTTDSSLPDCKNSELFCIWIIYHLSLLYGYSDDGVYLQSSSPRIRSNYEQVEKILKVYVCKGGKDGERDELDAELKIIIPLLHDLIINWWQPRISVISFLWDCFHKRLDQPFLQQTSGPWALSIERKSAADILKQINDRIDGKFEQSKESSYSMFLYLLGTFLRKYRTDVKYWNQVKGRVYTKFSKSKVEEFSESGLYNFISLFITLAITADTANVCSTMLDLLPATHEANNENNKRSGLVWKGKLACLLLFNERGLPLSPIAGHFVETINTMSCRKDEMSRSMMTNFVDVLSIILSSCEKMDLGEYHFIGFWIDRYFLQCSKNRIAFLLEMFTDIFEKAVNLQVSCDNSDDARKMLDALWYSVASRVRQLVFDPVFTGDNYKEISTLGIAFTLEAIRDPATAKKYHHSVVSLFEHFAASIYIKDMRIIQHYIASILRNSQAVKSLQKEIPNFNTIHIQAWIKCSIVGYGIDKEELKILQDYIIGLDEIKEIFVSDNDLQEFRNSNEPILTFIISLMKRQNCLKFDQEKYQYNTRCRTYFKNLEKWALISITEENKDSELAFWIYRCIGTLILCMSPTLYIRNQSNDMFSTLINKVILVPASSAQPYLKQLGKRIFSMIILGFGKLNVKSDIMLLRMMREIFDQYLPILITETSSGNFKVSDVLLKCFKEAKYELVRLIFEELMLHFYKISNDVMHKHSTLITWLIKTLLKEGRTYPLHIIEHIIQICFPSIFGCYMKVNGHHRLKLDTIDFISDVIKNPYYEEVKTIREKFQTVVSVAVQQYLLINMQPTFEFIRSIWSVKKNIIISIYPQIETIVSQAEEHSQPNANSLRFLWNQLKKHMLNMDSKI